MITLYFQSFFILFFLQHPSNEPRWNANDRMGADHCYSHGQQEACKSGLHAEPIKY